MASTKTLRRLKKWQRQLEREVAKIAKKKADLKQREKKLRSKKAKAVTKLVQNNNRSEKAKAMMKLVQENIGSFADSCEIVLIVGTNVKKVSQSEREVPEDPETVIELPEVPTPSTTLSLAKAELEEVPSGPSSLQGKTDNLPPQSENITADQTTNIQRRCRNVEDPENQVADENEPPAKRPQYENPGNLVDKEEEEEVDEFQKKWTECCLCHKALEILKTKPAIKKVVGKNVWENIRSSIEYQDIDITQFTCVMETILGRGKALEDFQKIQEQYQNIIEQCYQTGSWEQGQILAEQWNPT